MLSQQFLWESAANITVQRDERLLLKVNGPISRDLLELILREVQFCLFGLSIFRVQNRLLSQIIQSYDSAPFSLIKTSTVNFLEHPVFSYGQRLWTMTISHHFLDLKKGVSAFKVQKVVIPDILININQD